MLQTAQRGRSELRVCGDPHPGVHHREPGKSVLHLMIALYAGCHAKVHWTKVVFTEFSPLLLVLWREQHPKDHEQTHLDFNVRKPAALRVPLNFEPPRKIESATRYADAIESRLVEPQFYSKRRRVVFKSSTDSFVNCLFWG